MRLKAEKKKGSARNEGHGKLRLRFYHCELDFLKALSNNFPWPVGFAVGKDLSRLTSLALTLATSSLEITFSLRSRVINKSGMWQV